MEIIAQIIVGLAWPVMVLVIACMFRRPIIDLFTRVREFEAKSVRLILNRLEMEGQLPAGSRAELMGLSANDIWALDDFAAKKITTMLVEMKPSQRVAARTLLDAGLLTVRGEGAGRHVELAPLGQRVLDAAGSLL